MQLVITILAALLLQATVDATEVTFAKMDGKIYVQTDSQHYAMFGHVKDDYGVRIIAVNGMSRNHMTSRCETGWKDLHTDYNANTYHNVIPTFLGVKERSPAISGVPTNKYLWSETFSSEHTEYSALRLDDWTIVYTSSYFPGDLAKVILAGNVVIFVHHSGDIVMKTGNCLADNEKTLITGIKKIDLSGKKSTWFKSKGEDALKSYLKSHPINVSQFNTEQRYEKVYTERELAQMGHAMRGAAFTSFDGWKD